MKRLLSITILFLSFSALAQTYPKYNNQGGNKATSKTKPVKVTAEPVKKVKTGNFQELMDRGLAQFQAGEHEAAVNLMTNALDVSTKEEAWRALTSRAAFYTWMEKKDKAIADYTAIIDEPNLPQKRLAYTYLHRAKLLLEKNDMASACEDIAKAKALGLSDKDAIEFDCK